MPDLAKQFTREEILKALEYIDENNLSLIESTKYDLVYNGKSYPPKEVVRCAAELKNLQNWETYTLSGGENTNAPLRKLGFVIQIKDFLLNEFDEFKLINTLKKYSLPYLKEYYQFLDQIIEKLGLESGSEKYLFNESGKQINLTVGQKYAWCLKRNRKDNPFRALSNIKFSDVIEIFTDETNKYLNDVEDIAEIEEQSNSILSAIRRELEKTNKSSYSKFNDPLFEKLAFDVTYRNYIFSQLNVEATENYWIFQCNPQAYDLVGALKENIMTSWRVVNHKNKIKVGDKVVLWMTGPNAGVYATTLVTSNLYKRKALPTDRDYAFYHSEPTNEFEVVDLEIEHNFVLNPILKSTLENYTWFKKMKVGMQGTNFESSRIEYERILEASKKQKNNSVMKQPLNQILYGPPGTGKTFKLNKEFFSQFTIKQTSQSREQYLTYLVTSLNWWQVITLALLDIQKGKVQDIYQHELVKQKEKLSNSKTIIPTIWGQLQSHTVYECSNVNVERRQQPLYFFKDENSIWSIRKDLVEELYPEALELYNAYKNYQPSPDKIINNYDFVTFHQSFSYEDFIEGIKPDLEGNEGEVSYKIEPGIFKRLCERAKNDPSNSYALFIDEINRGNVSQIFGELITLIEEDKRIGKSEELYVTLPYSKEKFGVPANLYIIGTMNTADRSVEAIDTALRRRFSFEEMPPRYDLQGLHYSIAGIPAWEILQTINARIESLIDRDHAIGHAYFLHKTEETIMDSFYRNIIPLLQEYFFGDYGKIGLVLGKGFIRVKDETVKFATFNYDGVDSTEFKESYEIIDYRISENQTGFFKAILFLMNRNVEE